MPRILMDAGEAGTAFAIVCSLRRHWSGSIQIRLADTNPTQ